MKERKCSLLEAFVFQDASLVQIDPFWRLSIGNGMLLQAEFDDSRIF